MTTSTWWSCEFPCRSTGEESLPRIHGRSDHAPAPGSRGWGRRMTARIAAIALTASLTLTLPAPRLASPLADFRVVAAYRAPHDEFSAGHRGVDLAAHPGLTVSSPLSGVVSFSGVVAGRPVLSIRSGDAVVSLEPVRSDLRPGARVQLGEPLGQVASGGHCAWTCLHVGLRVAGAYVAPFALTARLLPWR